MADRTSSYGKIHGGKRALIPDFTVHEWLGTNTYISDITELKDGETPDSLNWLTGQYKDHIELRRGYTLLGTTRLAGAGQITGIGIGLLQNGTQVPIYSYGSHLMYYNSVTNNTAEIGSSALGAAAASDDVSIIPYQNLAGSFTYITSPNSSIYKVSTSLPTDYRDLNVRDYRGYGKVDSNRLWSWGRQTSAGISDVNDVIVGVVDKQLLSQYTQLTAQLVGTGDGATKTFAATMGESGVTNGAAATIFAIEVAGAIAAGTAVTGISVASQAVISMANTSSFTVGTFVMVLGVSGMTQINGLIGVVRQVAFNTNITVSIATTGFSAWTSGGTAYPCEHFVDDKCGNMVSNLGGTGTISYVSGAISVTFKTAPINAVAINAQYYNEDSSNGGITDFSIDSNTNGKGKIFPQGDGGGALKAIMPFDQVQYCFHPMKTWYVNLLGTTNPSSDVNSTNLPYRSNFGIPYYRSAFPTSDGILMVDTSHLNQPKIRFMEISPSVAALITVVPTSISDTLNLSSLGFNKSAARRWGDFDLVAYQNITNGVIDPFNTRVLVRNIYSGLWDIVDYAVSCFEEYYGTLIAGDSLSNNVFTLFSGSDDDGSLISNHWISKPYKFVEGSKKFNRFIVKGLIQSTQNIDISFAYEQGPFVKVFTVQGNASYVNIGNPVEVGSNTVGSQVVGGGNGAGPAITAYPYEVEFIVGSDIFEYVQVQFSANSIGYCSIDEYTFKDIRYKSKKIPSVKTIGN